MLWWLVPFLAWIDTFWITDLFEFLSYMGGAGIFQDCYLAATLLWTWIGIGIYILHRAESGEKPSQGTPNKGRRRRIARRLRLRPPRFRTLYRRSYPFRLRKHGIFVGCAPKCLYDGDPNLPFLVEKPPFALPKLPSSPGSIKPPDRVASQLSAPDSFSSNRRIAQLMGCSTLFASKSLNGGSLGLFNLNIEQTSLLQAIGPSTFNAGLHLGEMFSFIWDTGASYTVSPNREDFADGITPLDTPIVLDGLATGLAIQGKGHVVWMVPAVDGTLKTISVEAYYTPGARIRLLSPQSYLQQCDIKGWIKPVGGFSDKEMSLVWPDNSSIIVPYSETSTLPISLAYNESTVERQTTELHLCVTDMANQNLSEAQKELLRWHFRLGHINFATIQLLLRSGALATSEGAKTLHRAASKCELPKCASCQFGKMKRRPTESTISTPVLSSEGALKKNNLLPGQHVSVDHFICHTRGRLYNSKGKTKKESMFAGGCLFVDYASGLVHVEHQVAMTTHETLKSKTDFEAAARDSGVIIQAYTSDNGSAFSSTDFNKELSTFKQIIRFAGIGAHHHNGVAERNIQSIMCMARTMMLHAAIRWPETADTSLWPMAVDYAVYVHNHLPGAIPVFPQWTSSQVPSGQLTSATISMFGDVLSMFLTLRCKMERSSPVGLLGLVVLFLSGCQLSMPQQSSSSSSSDEVCISSLFLASVAIFVWWILWTYPLFVLPVVA